MRKVEIGATYENTSSDLRLIVPKKYDSFHSWYECSVTEFDFDDEGEMITREYEDYLTKSDILDNSRIIR